MENCTGSRLEFEDGTTSSNLTTSNPSYRTRLFLYKMMILTIYSHCMEEKSDGKNLYMTNIVLYIQLNTVMIHTLVSYYGTK